MIEFAISTASIIYTQRGELAYITKIVGKLAVQYTLLLFFVFFVSTISGSISDFILSKISVTESVSAEESLVYDSSQHEIKEVVVDYIITQGDTFSKVFAQNNVSGHDAGAISRALSKLLNVPAINPMLKIGQKITLKYTYHSFDNHQYKGEYGVLNKIILSGFDKKDIEVVRLSDGWEGKNIVVNYNKKLELVSDKINGNFVKTAKALGVKYDNIMELVHSYSSEIDINRRLKQGNKVKFLVEKFYNEDGSFSHNGKVIFSSINTNKKDYQLFRYANGKDKPLYYTEKGRSVSVGALKLPLKKSRVSSRFGKRKHPILGYYTMHKGVDFAAPKGTPIYAAGEGVVKSIGWKSGYGKFILIQHSNNLETAYAHADKYAANLKVGQRVSQGQLIAYVGKTGYATGVHLHFEVRVNKKHVDPLSFKYVPDRELKGKEYKGFEKFKKNILNQVSN